MVGPIYLAKTPRHRFTNKQPSNLPTLLFTRADFEKVKELMNENGHVGAFGEDYEIFSGESMAARTVGSFDFDTRTSWVVVWKIPSDLNYMRGFCPLSNVLVTVGDYDAIVDHGFDTLTSSKSSSKSPWWRNTTLRKYKFFSEPVIHFLQETGSTKKPRKVAMISSMYFFTHFWPEEYSDRAMLYTEWNAVKLLLHNLRETCGIIAYPCHGQHHAIILDRVVSGKLLTPRALATLLRCSKRATDLSEVLCGACITDTKRTEVRWWVREYPSTVQEHKL